jgi:hypothetical protein
MNDSRNILTDDANGIPVVATALAKKLSVRIPMALLTEETFASIASIAQMLGPMPPRTRTRTA